MSTNSMPLPKRQPLSAAQPADLKRVVQVDCDIDVHSLHLAIGFQLAHLLPVWSQGSTVKRENATVQLP
jgi:hypothetical protein